MSNKELKIYELSIELIHGSDQVNLLVPPQYLAIHIVGSDEKAVREDYVKNQLPGLQRRMSARQAVVIGSREFKIPGYRITIEKIELQQAEERPK